MNKAKTTESLTAEVLVNGLINELVSINRDIMALRSRLESGLKDQELILRNHRYLMEAIGQRDLLIDTLNDHYYNSIPLEKLMFDIQNND